MQLPHTTGVTLSSPTAWHPVSAGMPWEQPNKGSAEGTENGPDPEHSAKGTPVASLQRKMGVGYLGEKKAD